MPVIPQANFNQSIGLSTQSQSINPQAEGIMGQAVENVGKTALGIGLDVQQKMTEADAADFTAKNLNNFHIESSKFINDVNGKLKDDGSLNKGDVLPDGTSIDSENPHEVIQKWQDGKIASVNKSAKNGLEQTTYQNAVKNIALSNVLNAQGLQFKNKIEDSVRKTDEEGNLVASNGTVLGNETPFRADGSSTLGDLKNRLAGYRNYVGAKIVAGVHSEKVGNELVKRNAALTYDNYLNASFNQLNSGALTDDRERARFLISMKNAVATGEGEKILEPTTAQKYKTAISNIETKFFKQKQGNLSLSVEENIQSNLTNEKDDPVATTNLLNDIQKYGPDAATKTRLATQVALGVAASRISGSLRNMNANDRAAFIKSSLEVDGAVADVMKNHPELHIDAKASGVKTKLSLQKILTDRSDALVKEMAADSAAYVYKADPSKFAADKAIVADRSNKYSNEQRTKAMDNIILQNSIEQKRLGTKPSDMRSFSKPETESLAREMINAAKDATVSGMDTFNNYFKDSYSQDARFKLLAQAEKDGTLAGGLKVDALYGGTQHFPNSETMNHLGQLVARKSELYKLWNSSGKGKKELDALSEELATVNQNFFQSMGSGIGTSDIALQSSITELSKLYAMDHRLKNADQDDSDAAATWKDELEQNYKVKSPSENRVFGNTSKLGKFIYPVNIDTAKIDSWVENHDKVEDIEKLLKDNKVPLPRNFRTYKDLANSIRINGNYVGNESTTGIRIRFDTHGNKDETHRPSFAFLPGADKKDFEISFDAINKMGEKAAPAPDSTKKEEAPIQEEVAPTTSSGKEPPKYDKGRNTVSQKWIDWDQKNNPWSTENTGSNQ